ncbi:hypothetical protein [Aliamphritea spongicola]|uniref:hypothetical protein n=1 Tax=Aliamphritea spongicola TaxID=707589 RepID=UPI00196B8B33|nr:hypothetical protein [Aliamphritea spongicola]MBN3564851.1 hypothetical protein [Aliamphritea spongicola]
MDIKNITLFAHNGDCWVTPPSTMESLWAGLGGGANGLCLDVLLTRDKQIICTPNASLEHSCGVPAQVDSMNLDAIRKLDAGKTWRSSELDSNYQPTGAQGEDTPWDASSQRPVVLSKLEDVLRIFGRRTQLLIRLHDLTYEHQSELATLLTELLNRFGLAKRACIIAPIATCQLMRQQGYHGELAADLTRMNGLSPATLDAASCVDTDYQLAWAEEFVSYFLNGNRPVQNENWLLITQQPFAPTPETISALKYAAPHIAGLIAKGALPTSEQLLPPAQVMQDNFDGDRIDRNLWTAGYSHTNQDTRIYQEDGLHIDIKQGGEYSGAAAVTCDCYHGDFDAQVDFHVAFPHQGTTFEMAAIGIDPGYFNISNDNLNGKKVNLTFDVHGAPPYASSERDEDDGFRTGWNNSFNLTKIGSVSQENGELKIDDWVASSVNMYNKYRRDVGYGGNDSPAGTLRLIRRGPVFSSYYRDALNKAWVCSGTVLVHNLQSEAFIRLAAKHWKKRNPEPPKNKVTFKQFRLFQY